MQRLPVSDQYFKDRQAEEIAKLMDSQKDVRPAPTEGGGMPLSQQEPQTLTLQNQQAITRPRTVVPTKIRDMLTQQSQAPVTTNSDVPDTSPTMQPMRENPYPEFAPTVNGEPFGSRPRRTQMRDFVADDSQYLRDLENQPRNWKDKTVDAIRALDQHFNGPSQGLPTKRERDIARAQSTLGRDLAVDKQRSDSALKDLVDVTLSDGTTVKVPARGAGALQSQQQNVAQRATMNKARIDRLKLMPTEKRQAEIAKLVRSGDMNTPELLEYATDVLGLPAELKPHIAAGDIISQVDDNGSVQLVNKRTKEVYDTGIMSYETTKEKGRNARRDKNAADAMERTRIIAASGAAKMGDVPELEKTRGMLETYADEKDQEAKELEENGSGLKSDKENAAKLRTEATQYRLHAAGLGEAVAKARGAQNAAPSGRATLSRGTFNLGAWKADHPEATQAQIQAQRSKAKARQLSIQE
jgi:hypothetical protein